MHETHHLVARHRAQLADADRLVARAERLAGAAELEPPAPALLARDVRDWSAAVRVQHAALEDLPADLRADHAALGPALDRLQRTADALADGADEDTATALAVELAELRGALREHVDDERAVLLAGVPAVSRPRR